MAMLDEHYSSPSDLEKSSTDQNSNTFGRMGQHHILIASLSEGVYGTMFAITTASQMLSSFLGLRFGILVGIGAGVHSKDHDIRLGDVIVNRPDGQSGGVVQYDFRKVRQGQKYERKDFLNLPPEILLKAMGNLRAQHEFQSSRMAEFLEGAIQRYPELKPAYFYQGAGNERLFEASYAHFHDDDLECCFCDRTKMIQRFNRGSTQPEIRYDLIASGNTLFKDATERDKLVKELKDAGDGTCLCLEMEASGSMNNFT